MIHKSNHWSTIDNIMVYTDSYIQIFSNFNPIFYYTWLLGYSTYRDS